jgi:hypothetical protein
MKKNKLKSNVRDFNITTKSIKYATGMILTNMFFIFLISSGPIHNSKQMIIEGFPKILFVIFVVILFTEIILDSIYNLFSKQIEKKRVYMYFILSPFFVVFNFMAFYFLSVKFWIIFIKPSFNMFIGIYLLFCVSLFYFMNKFLLKLSKIKDESDIK